MTLSEWLTSRIASAVQGMLEEYGQDWMEQDRERIIVEQPQRPEHGDYATNIAMQLAKTLRKPPMLIASELQTRLEQSGLLEGMIAKVETASPGFVNMFIRWETWAQAEWAPAASPGHKAIVEHTSINPNKSAHIGHLRNACIGDSIVRMLRKAGRRVEVHNYIDDLGNQLADTIVGMLHVPLQESHARFGDFCWELYAAINRQYKEEPPLEEERTRVLHALEAGDTNISWMGSLIAERIVTEHLDEMREFGIEYDLLVWESDIVREGFWSSAFRQLQRTASFRQVRGGAHDGCWVLSAGDEGAAAESEFPTDKVLVRSNGILTYTAKDIAYHLWKYGLLENDFRYRPFAGKLWTTGRQGEERAFGHADEVINVIDYRQHYPQAMVRQALKALGYEQQASRLCHVSYSVVSLSPGAARELGLDTSDGKASYAMSGRQGIGVKVSQLLERMEQAVEAQRSDRNGLSSRAIAAAAIRYYLLRFQLQTEVVFDLQQATEITGNTGVYLLYAHARAVSLLSKAGIQEGEKLAPPPVFPPLGPPERLLLRHIACGPDRFQAACRELAPHLICSYAYELAAAFNQFYAACPIAKADEPYRGFRLWLVSRYQAALREALDVLGLPAPSRL